MGARDRSRLGRLRRRAALVLWAEALWRAAAPSCGILLAYLVIALGGGGGGIVCLIFCILAGLALAVSLYRLRRPSARRIDRRIEMASGLRHRPLAALDDEAAGDDPAALALWRRYQQGLRAELATARTGPPLPGAVLDDPFSLRILLGLLLLVSLVMAGPAATSRLEQAFIWPAWPFARPRVSAWIIPPDYAAAPPLLLTPGAKVTALSGSRLTVIVNGPRRAPPIHLGGTIFTATALSRTSHRADAVITVSGRLLAGPWWHRLAAWSVTVVAPGAPVISLRGMVIAGSKMTLDWRADDPYGLAAFTLAFAVTGYPNALPLDFALPLAAGDGSRTIDLATSPYHGLPVTFTLIASNIAGRTSSLRPHDKLVLPGLTLHDQTAAALDRLRQSLAVAPETAPVIADDLHLAAARPPSVITAAADVQMAAVAAALAARDITPRAAVDRLLLLIQEIEAGPDYAPGRALAQADAALQAALQRGLQGKTPDAATLNRLLQAMEQALARHIAALRPPGPTGQMGRMIDPAALDRLAQRIAADEAAGKTAQAAQELRQLQAALQALETATPMTAAQAAQAAAMQQASQGLSKLINGQASVLDNTNQGAATPDEESRLQAALAALRQQLRTLQPDTPGLASAAKAMSDAEGALAQGDNGPAEAAEGAAIQAMQKAAASLNAAGQNSLSIGQGNQEPLGGAPGGDGVNGMTDESNLPGFGLPAPNPAGVIEDRILKQNEDPDLPAATRQYFQRLLDPGEGE